MFTKFYTWQTGPNCNWSCHTSSHKKLRMQSREHLCITSATWVGTGWVQQITIFDLTYSSLFMLFVVGQKKLKLCQRNIWMTLYQILKLLASPTYFNISKKFLCTYMKLKFSMTFNFVNQTRLKSHSFYNAVYSLWEQIILHIFTKS